MKRLYEQGITLIALVVTIIILLILAGVTISAVINSNGIMQGAKTAVNTTNYQSAKETLTLKLMDIQADCIIKEINYNLENINTELLKDDNFTVELYYYKETASIRNGLTRNTEKLLKGIVVSAKKYEQYHFLLGEEGEITGVTTKDNPSIEDFDEIPSDTNNDQNDEPKGIESFAELLEECGIEGYTKQQIAQNVDNTLDTIINNSRSLEYIIDNYEEYGELFASSEEAVNKLSTNNNAKTKIIQNQEWLNAMKNSSYTEIFDTNMETIPIMTSMTEPSGEVSANCWKKENGKPYYAFDGDDDTGWYSSWSYKDEATIINEDVTFEDSITLIYKYPTQRQIFKLMAKCRNITNGASNNTFTIWISPDENGDTWNQVYTNSWNWDIGYSGEIRNEIINLESTQTVRRIKIRSYLYCYSSDWYDSFEITKFQAYGI